MGLAERAAPGLEGPDQAAWLGRLERDHDNLRAALAWSRSEAGDPEAGLRLGGALRGFWHRRGHLAEGRRWLAAVLAAPPGRASDRARAGALLAAGDLAYLQGDHAAARAALAQSLALYRGLGDPAGCAGALSVLAAVALRRGDPGARALAEEAVACARAAGALRPLARALFNLGRVAGPGDRAGARAHLAESLGALPGGRRRLVVFRGARRPGGPPARRGPRRRGAGAVRGGPGDPPPARRAGAAALLITWPSWTSGPATFPAPGPASRRPWGSSGPSATGTARPGASPG